MRSVPSLPLQSRLDAQPLVVPEIPSPITRWRPPRFWASSSSTTLRYPFVLRDPSPTVMLSPNARYVLGVLFPIGSVTGTSASVLAGWGTATGGTPAGV